MKKKIKAKLKKIVKRKPAKKKASKKQPKKIAFQAGSTGEPLKLTAKQIRKRAIGLPFK